MAGEKLSEILKDKASISNLGTNALANDRHLLGINASAKRFFDFVLNQPLESKEKL